MNSQFGNDGPDPSNQEKPVLALWTPGWYSLDHSLRIGEASTFSFFQSTPSGITLPEDCQFVFFNGLDDEAETQTFDTTVLSISHPILGEIVEVDTKELDYLFVLANGERVEVNAEEDPGVCVDGNYEINDWDLTVCLYGMTPENPQSNL